MEQTSSSWEGQTERLRTLEKFLNESPYFKAVQCEQGYDLFVPKKYRININVEWFQVDPTFMVESKEKEEVLVYRDKLKDLFE